MYASAAILIFGHDSILLETRSMVLRGAGFKVWTATDATLAIEVLVTKRIDLFMLCQTLSREECVAVLKTAHTLRPDMKNLVLTGVDFDEPKDKRDIFFTSFLDPGSLIALIQQEINAEHLISLRH